jgi:death-on-curing protein
MSVSVRYLELADFLLIAEKVLGVPAETLARLPRMDLADSALNAPAGSFGGTEAYPEFERKAAVLTYHLVRNHPLPDGNKRVAFLSLLEFAARNGHTWKRTLEDPEDTDRVFRRVAAGKMTVEELRVWIVGRVT